MAETPKTEVWQRGPVPGYEPLLLPVVHAFLQAREDLERLVQTVPDAVVWERPNGAASVGFHVRHVGGALDRLLTYARGEALSDSQREIASREKDPGDPPASLAAVVADVGVIIDRSLDQVRATTRDMLLEPRKVGRAGLPSTVLGLLFHAAEHATRHVGQAITTARIVGGHAEGKRT